jgi:hypothetical protein
VLPLAHLSLGKDEARSNWLALGGTLIVFAGGSISFDYPKGFELSATTHVYGKMVIPHGRHVVCVSGGVTNATVDVLSLMPGGEIVGGGTLWLGDEQVRFVLGNPLSSSICGCTCTRFETRRI